MNGTFIVFEGIDGTGKSTQLRRLANALEAAGHPCVVTGEPWRGSAAGRKIRAAMASAEPLDAEFELELFLEQRRDHVREWIRPALERGEVVLCDRYYFSTVAYQGARGLDWRELLAANEAEGFPEPDLLLLFDMDPAVSLGRVDERAGTAEPTFEEPNRLEAARKVYRRIERDYVVVIDANDTLDAVGSAVADAVRERLALP